MAKTSKTSTFFLWLTLAVAVYLTYPGVDTQSFLANSDQGRDLYAFDRTLHGDVPYQDFGWIYGPLMPYYYALFNHLLGTSIASILAGKAILIVLNALLAFLAIETIFGGLAGFAAALWWLAFSGDFFYTYNHVGGITSILFIVLCLVRYCKTRAEDWLWCGTVGIFILSLIKLNCALAAIPILMLTAYLTDKTYAVPLTGRKQFFHLFNLVLLPGIIATVYWLFFYGLSWPEIRHCLFFQRPDELADVSLTQLINHILPVIQQNIVASRTGFFFTAALCTCIMILINRWANKARKDDAVILNRLVIIVLSLLSLATLQEYFYSGSLHSALWAQPAAWLLALSIIFASTHGFSRIVRNIAAGVLILAACIQCGRSWQDIKRYHSTEHYLLHPRCKVYTSNSTEWIKTVLDTSEYLKQTVPSHETFFALPLDPLYYYTTEKPYPSRTQDFYADADLGPARETAIIREIELARINFVLLSNRVPLKTSSSDGEKFFYPLLSKHIDDNFTAVAQFGDWSHPDTTGTMIMQRKGLRK